MCEMSRIPPLARFRYLPQAMCIAVLIKNLDVASTRFHTPPSFNMRPPIILTLVQLKVKFMKKEVFRYA